MKVLSDRERLRGAIFDWYMRTLSMADTFPPGLHGRALALLYVDAKGTPNDSATEDEYLALLREINHRPDDAQWPTQVKVARGLDLPNRMSVKRLIDRGELKTNGATGKACRVDPASVLAYCQKAGIAYNDTDVS